MTSHEAKITGSLAWPFGMSFQRELENQPSHSLKIRNFPWNWEFDEDNPIIQSLTIWLNFNLFSSKTDKADL